MDFPAGHSASEWAPGRSATARVEAGRSGAVWRPWSASRWRGGSPIESGVSGQGFGSFGDRAVGGFPRFFAGRGQSGTAKTAETYAFRSE